MNAQEIAKALEECDWSGVPIGNKVIIQAAIDELKTECDHEWVNIEYNQIRSVDQCCKCHKLRTGRGNY